MSSILTDYGILHYETIGHGSPLILLHGWINSWSVWREPMIALASSGHYRVYALDFWGFGDSSKQTAAGFHVSTYASMVRQFTEALGIKSAPLAGHSLGGTVALTVALKWPALVDKVVIVGSPIVGTTLNPFLKLAGYGWIADLAWRTPGVLPAIMWMLLARDSEKVRQMISRDIKRATLESFFRSIGDLRITDLRPELGQISPPVAGIFGTRDNIVSPRNARILQQYLPSAQVRNLVGSRHFPMVDQTQPFLAVLHAFLQQPDSHDDQQQRMVSTGEDGESGEQPAPAATGDDLAV